MASAELENSFVVRAHHMPTFAEALKRGSGKQAYEQYDVAFRSLTEGREDYYTDIFGFEEGYGGEYVRKLQEAFESLRTLEGDQMVTVRMDMSDGLCKACKIGDHCKRTDYVVEGKWLDKLRKVSGRMGIEIKDNRDSISLKAESFREILIRGF